ncbi:unnamed protein product [Cuscuta europaea]|uniref:Uncharacterized protein n=1 Tax=Cuscuta europaea TaxID=41803 RepID=A0A9P0ZZ89_CUSEU|nr:unnamed protein product [Cuscuta europaea]
MDNLLLPKENCFSTEIKVIGFAPKETINFVPKKGIYIVFERRNEVPSSIYIPLYCRITFHFWVSTYNINESHIHPSTCSSTLRTSPKSGRFRDISYWLSFISNKLFNSWHL